MWGSHGIGHTRGIYNAIALCNRLLRDGIRVDRDAPHADLLDRPVLGVNGHLFHRVKCAAQLSTINDLANNGILAVQMRLLTVGDKKLRSVHTRRRTCDLFVFGALLAIATIPRALNLSVGRISSSNGAPQIDSPPLPVPVGSPVCVNLPRTWIINPAMFRCHFTSS